MHENVSQKVAAAKARARTFQKVDTLDKADMVDKDLAKGSREEDTFKETAMAVEDLATELLIVVALGAEDLWAT